MAKRQKLGAFEYLMLGVIIVGGGYSVFKYFGADKPTTATPPPPPPSGGGTTACPTWNGTTPAAAVLADIATVSDGAAMATLSNKQQVALKKCDAGGTVAYLQRIANLRKGAQLQVDGRLGPLSAAAFGINGTEQKTVYQIITHIGGYVW